MAHKYGNAVRLAVLALWQAEIKGKAAKKFAADASPFQAQLATIQETGSLAKLRRMSKEELMKAANIIVAAVQAAGNIAKDAGIFPANIVPFEKEIDRLNSESAAL